MGANEIKATVGSNGEIRFDNLAHIDSLDPTDLLSIRLYLNHDAANTLWEWAFTRNGLHVYYEVPGNTEKRDDKVEDDIEILSLLEPIETGQSIGREVEGVTPSVRTLGGMRLRYQYKPPSLQGIEVTKVTWKINKKGAYCLDYGIGLDHCPSSQDREAGVEYELKSPQTDWSVYWEPRNGNSKPDWTNWAEDEGVDAYMEAEYTVPITDPNANQQRRVSRVYKRDFKIKTRELKPLAKPEKPMEGSDVQILEAMLWAFGVSPQRGEGYGTKSRAGISGWRINSQMLERDKNKKIILNEHTKFCDGSKADARNIYVGGWDNCSRLNVSLEVMVRRFKGRHVSAAYAEQKERSGGKNENGVVDEQMLKDLGATWTNYYSVYLGEHKNHPTILLKDAIVDAYLDDVVELWQKGSGSSMPPSYTDTVNKNVLKLAGLSEDSKTQKDLLKAWKSRETDSHWGSNTGKPSTNYRMTEGGGDTLGSMSFNQVLFQYRYSRKPLKVHKDFNFNYFDPRENMLGFAVHTSAYSKGDANSINSAGALYEAFGKRSMADLYSTNQGLVGYKHCNTVAECQSASIKALNSDKKDDDYELLARAVLRYNAGSSGNQGISWPDLLRTMSYCKGCGMEYSIDVRNARFGLPYRQYIWKGGVEPDEIPVMGSDGKPETNEGGSTKMQANPKAGQDWCFAYGEQEWIGGKDWSKVKADAAPLDENGDLKSRTGNIACSQ